MKLQLLAILLVSAVSVYSQSGQKNNPTWEEIQKTKNGNVTVYWFDNNPFFHKDKDGKLKGIEFEILDGFRKYVKDTFNINLQIQWAQVKSFEEVFDKIKNNSQVGVFGSGGFSITDERRKIVKFSPSYMADIAVLVSTLDIPILKSKSDFKTSFFGATAIVIPGTLMEKDIKILSDTENVPFKIEYVSNSFGFLDAIKSQKKAFGYLSLPVYLMNLDAGKVAIKRQNYFTKIKDGHGIGFPKNSDWDLPMNAYFKSRDFKSSIEDVIAHYISLDFYHFLETVTNENEVTLLNKEKEIQQKEIQFQEFQITEKTKWQKFLVAVIIIFMALFTLILILFRKNLRDNLLLKEQKDEIEAQADEIKSINENLELLVKQRTQDLEIKNNALQEYAFITAHKLRAPLASILGLVLLFEQVNLKEEGKIMLSHLKQSAVDLDVIISLIMKSIENADQNSTD